MRTLHRLLLPLLLGTPTLATALPPPHGFSMETAVSAAPGGSTVGWGAAASCWIDGALEGEARLVTWSAPRPPGRAADALTPSLGLRWVPDLGRWRPLLGVEAGVWMMGSATAPLLAGRAGIELFARREVSLSVAVGWRWTGRAGAGAEARLGLTYYP